MAPKGVVSMLPPDRGQHKRTKSSSSMIKSIISSKAQKKTQSEDVDARAQTLQHHKPQYGYDNGNYSTPILPADHPHAEYAVLGEIANHDNGPASPRKSSNEPRGRPDSLYMRTKSSESTTTLDKEKGKDPKRSRRHKEEAKPKKSKSATSLTSLFTKNRSAKDLTQLAKQPRDKENTTPPSSATANGEPVTPIWAHYATQFEERSTTTKIPLNDASRIKRELELYNPTEYSPSKQKDYFGMEEPKLAKRSTRPKSVEIAANSAKALFQSAARKSSDEPRMKGKEERRTPSRPRPATSNSTPVLGSRPTASVTAPSSPAKRGTRVMAAVANLNDKTKEAEVESLDPKNVDAAFEAVLESRNIPEAQRQKMRTLKLSLKVDFIRSHKVEGVQTPTEGTPSEKVLDKDSVNKDVKKSSKSKGSLKNAEAIVEDELDDRPETPKRSRPRSRTFTFSKSDKGDSSSSKKAKGAERDASTHRKDKSVNIPKSPSTTSLAGTASAGSSIRSQAPKTTAPDEFVQYIHSAMRLQNVEVGRLHKLRLLLRNETVAWVDSFIREGGMTEIVALLHRIMEVEWREEHEDALLHEALLCLKGLCTTDLALQKLCEVESTLFPALLAMLFDKERKGPSEFNTRGIIVNMLFIHLSAASSTELPSRARTILSYLRDTAPQEGSGTLSFVLDMHQPRPYRVWCKEIVDVTKEVFWIFLHHLNVVSLPSAAGAAAAEPKAIEQTPPPESILSSDKPLPKNPTTTTSPSSSAPPPNDWPLPRPTSSCSKASYTSRHFPGERPIVPAAPYVGGVEWDATNYLATHLDLLNGLLASLPTRSERNELRMLVRDSGFEKAMGAQLRTCKEKFYGAVHVALRTWVAAASEDGWDVSDVRFGPKVEEVRSVRASPKKKVEKAPKLEIPPELKLDVGAGGEGQKGEKTESGDNWTFDI